MSELRLFLCYRRQDMLAAGIVGRIHERLAARYGADHVFIDDTIPPGQDFRRVLDEAVGRADVFLAVIGPQWLELLNQRRGDPDDFVRIEIESALRRDIPVVPLLIGNAGMPRGSELPESIEKLSDKNAVPLHPRRDFDVHMARLITDLDRHYGSPRAWRAGARPTHRRTLITVVLLGIAAVLAGGYWLVPGEEPGPEPEQGATGQTVVEFGALNLLDKPGYTVAAAPHLNRFGIGVGELVPAVSSVVIRNNLGFYGGQAIRPQDSENFLTQIHTGNVPASFTLEFSEPLARVSFTRPALYPATASGVTHPAWTAEALDRNGEVLSSQSEGLIRSFVDVPAASYPLRAPGLTGITALRFRSDLRHQGEPFAAFEALLIERLVLEPWSEPSGG